MSALGPRIASPWAGHTIYLPTLHGKGPTLTSVLAPTLGITQVQEVPVDTDKLGTFCGAVDRPNGPLFALATKIAAAKEMVPEGRLFMASEGSFRPHPTVPLQMVNLEWLKFADLDSGFECTVQSMTTTMENHERRVTHVDELHEALAPYRLPEHAVMVGLPGAPGVFFQALTTREQIAAAVDAGAEGYTHLGNGCPGEIHRHDNIIFRVLDEPRLRASLIAEGRAREGTVTLEMLADGFWIGNGLREISLWPGALHIILPVLPQRLQHGVARLARFGRRIAA